MWGRGETGGGGVKGRGSLRELGEEERAGIKIPNVVGGTVTNVLGPLPKLKARGAGQFFGPSL